MSHRTTDDPEEDTKGKVDRKSLRDAKAIGERKKQRKKIIIVLCIVVAVIASLFVGIVIANANNSNSGDIKNGDYLSFSLLGEEDGHNIAGSCEILVTSVTSSSLTVEYTSSISDYSTSITSLSNTTTQSATESFSGSSFNWNTSIFEILNCLSGSTNVTTSAGSKVTNFTLSDNSYVMYYTANASFVSNNSVVLDRMSYWLDPTTNCPYQIACSYYTGENCRACSHEN